MGNPANLGTDGFADGERYQSARPSYPSEAVAFLVESLAITAGSHVLDLGAGTGIFTELLVPFGARITAVDPVPGMRDVLTLRLPGVEVLDGRDVASPLATSSVDAVVVAQAFHWFDAEPALREIHRVLVAGGGLGLIWNERDESVPWVAQLGRAMRWPEHQPYRVGMDFTPVLAAGPFDRIERRTFRYEQLLDHELLRRRVLTTSYIAVMPDGERDELMRDVDEVLDTLPEAVVLPHVTSAYRASATID